MLSLWLHNPAMKEDILQTLLGHLSQINSLPHNISRQRRIFHRSIHYPSSDSWKAVTDHRFKHWYQLSVFRKMTRVQPKWWQPSIKRGFWTMEEPQNNNLFNFNGFIFFLSKIHTSLLFVLRLITIVWSHKNPSLRVAFCCIPQLHSQIMYPSHKALIFSHCIMWSGNTGWQRMVKMCLCTGICVSVTVSTVFLGPAMLESIWFSLKRSKKACGQWILGNKACAQQVRFKEDDQE